MPIKIKKQGKKYIVYNSDTGRVHGRHPNKQSADKQIAAMAANGVDISGKGEKKPVA
jgi:hypothetical protein